MIFEFIRAPDLDHTRFLVTIIHRLKGATLAQAERSELTIERETLRELQTYLYTRPNFREIILRRDEVRGRYHCVHYNTCVCKLLQVLQPNTHFPLPHSVFLSYSGLDSVPLSTFEPE